MELDSKGMAIEQLQEENKNLNVELVSLRALVPMDADNSMLTQQGIVTFKQKYKIKGFNYKEKHTLQVCRVRAGVMESDDFL